MTAAIHEATLARDEALVDLRAMWISEGPLACGPCADQENLFAAIRKFMECDRALRDAELSAALRATRRAADTRI